MVSMSILAISGDGIGAGKSTAAKALSRGNVWSLAGALREEMQRDFPGYDWFNKGQDYKENTKVRELGVNVRTALIDRGQIRCNEDPAYWVRKLCDKVEATDKLAGAPLIIAIDDVRKVLEINYLRDRFGKSITHIHMINRDAIYEPQFENAALAEMADYHMGWNF